MKIEQYGIPNINIRQEAPVTGDAETATIKSDIKAKAFSLIGNLADSFQEKRIEARENDYLTKTLADTELEIHNTFLNFQRERQNNPENFTQDFSNYMQEVFTKKAEAAPTNKARDEINRQFSRYVASYGTKAATYENNRQIEIYSANLDMSLTSRMELAARTGGDKKELDRLYVEYLDEVNRAEAREDNPNGYLPMENANTRRMKAKSIYATGLESQIIKSPEIAIQSIQSGVWGEIDPITLSEAEQKAQRKIDAVYRENKYKYDTQLDATYLMASRDGDFQKHAAAIEAMPIPDQEKDMAIINLEASALIGKTKKDFSTMSPDEIMEQMELTESAMQEAFKSNKSDKFAELNKVFKIQEAALIDRSKAVKQDPVDYLAEVSGEDKRSYLRKYDRMIVDQKRVLGVDENNIKLLTKAQATGVVEQFNNADNVTAKINVIDSLKNEAMTAAQGNQQQGQKYFRYMMNSLRGSGVDRDMFTIAALDPVKHQGTRREITKLMKMKLENPKGWEQELNSAYKSMAKANADDITIEANINEKFSDLIKTWSNNPTLGTPDHIEKIRQDALNIAKLSYTADGDPALAVEKATKAFIDDAYVFEKYNGNLLRLPNGVKVDEVKLSLDRLKDDVINGNLGTLITKSYENYPDAFKDVLQRDSFFVTSADDTKLQLVVNTPEGVTPVEVTDKNGKAKTVTINISDAEKDGTLEAFRPNKTGSTVIDAVKFYNIKTEPTQPSNMDTPLNRNGAKYNIPTDIPLELPSDVPITDLGESDL